MRLPVAISIFLTCFLRECLSYPLPSPCSYDNDYHLWNKKGNHNFTFPGDRESWVVVGEGSCQAYTYYMCQLKNAIRDLFPSSFAKLDKLEKRFLHL